MLNLRGEGMDYPLKAYIYLFISIIVYNLVAWLIPKRMTKQEMYTTTIFALYFQAIVDVYLDLKYHLYWQWDWGIDYISMLMMLGIYPAANIIILNYFPYGKGTRNQATYILVWTILLVLYEIGSKWAGILHYKEWKLYHSAMAYPVILIILAFNLWIFRHKLSQK